MDNILTEILKLDFNSIYNTDNLDSDANIFIEYTQKIILKKIYFIISFLLKLWITVRLSKSIRNRDKMHV